MVTFRVDDVKNNSQAHSKTGDVKQFIGALTGTKVEAVGAGAHSVLPHTGFNAFVQTLHTAYDEHRSLVLRPDDLWLVIAQGVAQHINANAEALRRRFVEHEGQVNIEVRRDHFVKGSELNDWPDAFEEFRERIAEHVGKQHALFLNNFTTTDLHSEAASAVVLMDAMQSYFRYSMRTRCGIPSVTLLGETADWEAIRERVKFLAEYDLGWWTDILLPLTQRFVEASEGRVDRTFWKNIFKEDGGSGGPYVNGWVIALFPYLKSRDHQMQKNHFIVEKREPRGMMDGVTYDRFPSGFSSAPFKWHYYDQTFDMKFVAGFVGTEQLDNGEFVAPAIGWGVGEVSK